MIEQPCKPQRHLHGPALEGKLTGVGLNADTPNISPSICPFLSCISNLRIWSVTAMCLKAYCFVLHRDCLGMQTLTGSMQYFKSSCIFFGGQIDICPGQDCRKSSLRKLPCMRSTLP